MPHPSQSYSDLSYNLRSPPKTPWVLLVMVLGAAGYGVFWGLKERGRLMSQATSATVGQANAETARKELEKRMQALETENAEILATRDALAKSVEEKASELAALKGTYDKLQEKMKVEIAHGDIQLTHSGGKLRVGLVDKILFDSGAARISKRGEGVLGRVGAVLAGIADRQIQVSGHTDTTPISDKLQEQFPSNWELSTARATNVVRFLGENAGVPADRLVASGYGEHQPIASNKTAQGRARNRRIEILLTPSLTPQQISAAALKEKDRRAAAAEGAAGGAAQAAAPPAALAPGTAAVPAPAVAAPVAAPIGTAAVAPAVPVIPAVAPAQAGAAPAAVPPAAPVPVAPAVVAAPPPAAPAPVAVAPATPAPVAGVPAPVAAAPVAAPAPVTAPAPAPVAVASPRPAAPAAARPAAVAPGSRPAPAKVAPAAARKPAARSKSTTSPAPQPQTKSGLQPPPVKKPSFGI